jgi:hypothetical protein
VWFARTIVDCATCFNGAPSTVTGIAADWLTFVTALQQNNTAGVQALVSNLIFHAVNSWDVTWGEGDVVSTMPGGMYRANINYFNQAEDLCVVDLKAAA